LLLRTRPEYTSSSLRFPVVAHGAEFLVQGYLMRRNILTYKAPPNNEGYDLICIHPDPRVSSKQIRVQVKSRYATDCDRGFPVKARTFDAFDFLVVAFLNIGSFSKKRKNLVQVVRPPEFFTLPRVFVQAHHDPSSWERVRLRGLDSELAPYRDDRGFELIARKLRIPYPSRDGAPRS
jgi:hypothetical protein